MKKIIDEINYQKMFKKIKLVCMDVDGVLTDGSLYINQDGKEFKKFDVKDGIGIRLLQKHSFEIAWISGGSSAVTETRAKSLGIKYIFTKVKNKYIVLQSLQKSLNITSSETIFLGDDINDLVVSPLVIGFCAPSDAHEEFQKNSFWVAKKKEEVVSLGNLLIICY